MFDVIGWIRARIGGKKRRVTLQNPRFDLPCKWCGDVLYTTEEEIWCEADPTGHIVRLCTDCQSKCAAG